MMLERDLEKKLKEKNLYTMAHSIKATYAHETPVGGDVTIRTYVDRKGIRLFFLQQMIDRDTIINEAETVYVLIQKTETPTENGIREDYKPAKLPDDLWEILTGPKIVEVPFTSDVDWLISHNKQKDEI